MGYQHIEKSSQENDLQGENWRETEFLKSGKKLVLTREEMPARHYVENTLQIFVNTSQNMSAFASLISSSTYCRQTTWFSNHIFDSGRVDKYEYLSVISNSKKRSRVDILACNAEYLCHQTRRAISNIHRKSVSVLCHYVLCAIYTKGYYNLSYCMTVMSGIKVLIWVKASTSNPVTVRECGQTNPSIITHMYILCHDAKFKGLPK